MKNLAGDQDCDVTIRRELERCGLAIVVVPRVSCEVPYSLTGAAVTRFARWYGKESRFVFTRSWRYWVAQGPLPLPIAASLYECERAWREDVRAGGHCGAEHPSEHATHYTADGKKITTREDEALFKSIVDAGDSLGIADEAKDLVFADDPAAAAAYSVVELFHIDSELGLRLFAQTIGSVR